MGRAPCCDKANVKRGPWSPDEDKILKSYIEQQGTGGNWIALPTKAGLRRCGKSCRLRWLNYLRPNIKHGAFTEEEDRVILSLYNEIGSRWSIIAAKLHGRTDNDVKNHWNTKLKKLIMKDQTASSEINITKPAFSSSVSSEHDSFRFVRFPNSKTEFHQESLPTMPNLLSGDVPGYGSGSSFFHHDSVGFLSPTGLGLPTSFTSKTAISPSSSINAGPASWSNTNNSAEENVFLTDIFCYPEGMMMTSSGCNLFESTVETENQNASGGVQDFGTATVPSFSAMLSDYLYEFKQQGVFQSGLIDQY